MEGQERRKFFARRRLETIALFRLLLFLDLDSGTPFDVHVVTSVI